MTSDTDIIQGERELETPVSVPETETPEAEIPRASAFALSALTITESAAVESPPAPVQEVGTLAEAHAKILALNAALPAADKTARKAHGVLLAHARAAWHKLSQSEPPPRIDQAAHWRGMRSPSQEALAYFTGTASKSKSKRG
jgi:hypothetical protein